VARRTARRRTPTSDALKIALLAADAAEAKRAESVVVLDLRGQTLVTDYFVLCTGMSRVQLRAIVDGVTEAVAEHRPRPVREGDESADWVLLDYGDIVVHAFGPQARAFYRLERLWDAPVVPR
jgi:ribosome-associated protein